MSIHSGVWDSSAPGSAESAARHKSRGAGLTTLAARPTVDDHGVTFIVYAPVGGTNHRKQDYRHPAPTDEVIPYHRHILMKPHAPETDRSLGPGAETY